MPSYNINYIFTLIDQFSSPATRMQASASRLAGALDSLGGAAMTAGGALGGVFLGGLNAAAKFEDKMAEVRKVVPDMTKETMWKMGEEVQRLSIWSGEATKDIADIFAAGARMGIRGTEALAKYAETVTKVKVAWDGVSASAAGEAIANISGKFFGGQDPREAQKRMVGVADAINYLGQNTAGVKPNEILKFFQNSGSIFAAQGFTPEETSAYAAAAMKAGQPSGLMEGTRARSTMQRLRAAIFKPAIGRGGLSDTGKAFQALGITQQEFADMMRIENGAKGFYEVMSRLEKLDPQKRGQVIKQLIGDQRAAFQMEAMVGQLNEFRRALATSSDEWAKFFVRDKAFMDWLAKERPDQAKLLRDRDAALHWGSVDQEFNTRMDTLVKQMNRAGQAWDALRVNLAKPLLDPLAGGFSWLTDLLQSMGKAEGFAKNLSIGLAGLAGLGTLVGAGALTSWMLGMNSVLAGLMMLGIGAATLTVTVALVGAGAALFSNPEWFTKPLNLDIRFPDAPEWLKWLSGVRDGELRAQERFAKYGFDDAAYRPLWSMPSSADAIATMRSDMARAWVTSNPTMQFITPPPMPDLTTMDRIRGLGYSEEYNRAEKAWSGRDTLSGAELAAAIPRSIAVTSTVEARFAPAHVQVNVTGRVDGPVQGTGSGTLHAEPARGTSMSTVGAGGGAGPGGPGIP